MKYAIIEDQPLSMQQLHRIMQRLRPNAQLTFTAESVSETREFLSSAPDTDLIFMDISLSDGNVFAMLEDLNPSVPIIFTTAYDDFAVRAFRLNSIGYLLKPVLEEDVAAVLDKFDRTCKPSDLREVYSLLNSHHRRRRIVIEVGNTIMHLPIEEIACFISDDRYIFAVEHSGRRHLTAYPNLTAVSEDMPASFFRLSRGMVASVNAIGLISRLIGGRLQVEIRTGSEPLKAVVSASRRADFLAWLADE